MPSSSWRNNEGSDGPQGELAGFPHPGNGLHYWWKWADFFFFSNKPSYNFNPLTTRMISLLFLFSCIIKQYTHDGEIWVNPGWVLCAHFQSQNNIPSLQKKSLSPGLEFTPGFPWKRKNNVEYNNKDLVKGVGVGGGAGGWHETVDSITDSVSLIMKEKWKYQHLLSPALSLRQGILCQELKRNRKAKVNSTKQKGLLYTFIFRMRNRIETSFSI